MQKDTVSKESMNHKTNNTILRQLKTKINNPLAVFRKTKVHIKLEMKASALQLRLQNQQGLSLTTKNDYYDS